MSQPEFLNNPALSMPLLLPATQSPLLRALGEPHLAAGSDIEPMSDPGTGRTEGRYLPLWVAWKHDVRSVPGRSPVSPPLEGVHASRLWQADRTE